MTGPNRFGPKILSRSCIELTDLIFIFLVGHRGTFEKLLGQRRDTKPAKIRVRARPIIFKIGCLPSTKHSTNPSYIPGPHKSVWVLEGDTDSETYSWKLLGQRFWILSGEEPKCSHKQSKTNHPDVTALFTESLGIEPRYTSGGSMHRHSIPTSGPETLGTIRSSSQMFSRVPWVHQTVSPFPNFYKIIKSLWFLMVEKSGLVQYQLISMLDPENCWDFVPKVDV